jgi:diaminopimelate epimerase
VTSAQPQTPLTAPHDAPSPWGELRGRRFSKGHGTGNDFVLLTDPQGELELGPGLVALA